jgi:hypothetical protein
VVEGGGDGYAEDMIPELIETTPAMDVIVEEGCLDEEFDNHEAFDTESVIIVSEYEDDGDGDDEISDGEDEGSLGSLLDGVGNGAVDDVIEEMNLNDRDEILEPEGGGVVLEVEDMEDAMNIEDMEGEFEGDETASVEITQMRDDENSLEIEDRNATPPLDLEEENHDEDNIRKEASGRSTPLVSSTTGKCLVLFGSLQ